MTTYNLEQLYTRTFGSVPYKVPGYTEPEAQVPGVINGAKQQLTQITGSTLVTQFNGVEIWLPVWFRDLPPGIGEQGVLFLPHTVIKIQSKKTFVSTPLAERKGTVKEQYNIDDYQINIKGFLIDQARQWPEKELRSLKSLYELNQAVSLDNALTNVFLSENDKVVIKSFDLPEVEGGRNHVRPFSISLESDSIFELEYNN